jgi:predicted nucleic acid-binding protein
LKRYIDTSVLTAVYCAEPGSAQAQKAVQRCEPIISVVARLEFSSAVAKKVRVGTLSVAEGSQLISQFCAHIRDGVYALVPVTDAHYATANEWVNAFTTPLRTLDALHLAVASGHNLSMLSADEAVLQSAKVLGVSALKP